MSCDVGEVAERLENEQSSFSAYDVGEAKELVTWEKRKKDWRMNCDVGKATEGWRISCDVVEVTERLENEQNSF